MSVPLQCLEAIWRRRDRHPGLAKNEALLMASATACTMDLEDHIKFRIGLMRDGRLHRESERTIHGQSLRVATMSGSGALVDLLSEEIEWAVHRLAIPVVHRPPKGWRLFSRRPRR